MSTTASSWEIKAGAQPISGYTLRERIGSGGYGEVWSADAPGGLIKAIKIIYGSSEDTRALRELKSLERMKLVRHPFLLSIERIEVVDGHVAIVTELAESSLKDEVDRCRKAGQVGISRTRLLTWLNDAADALDFLYQRHALQHLDVKPENLLLLGGRVKVADFGLLKDLSERQCSLMGGLTPLYAPPEVFDGRPNQHSDQYSLAIVYQELLTGEAPFSGRTAAQLAAQHLQGTPSLRLLSPSDSVIVARALAKDPAARFPSCRAFVGELLAVGSVAAGSTAGCVNQAGAMSSVAAATPAAAAAAAAVEIESATSSAGSDTGDVEGDDDAANSTGYRHTAVLDKSFHPGGEARRSASAADRDAGSESLPPVTPQQAAQKAQPTVIIGVGGTAAGVLPHLHRRLRDRYGDLDEVPALRFLLLDTDAAALRAAVSSDGSGLHERDTFSAPLRPASDYRKMSASLLEWMSRRWLYNIPRSLRTEGIRSLGRLALIDHAARMMDLLRKVFTEVTHPDAIAASATSTGMEFSTTLRPRVWLVSSTDGGAGSGMVLDLAFAVRHVLTELGLGEHDVCGLLTHGTQRRGGSSEVALANTYALFRELRHYSGPANAYPGAAPAPIPSFPHHQKPFDATYYVNLGERLDEEQFAHALESVAQYLEHAALTPASPYLSFCRAEQYETGGAGSESLRSFHLHHIGNSDDSLIKAAVEAVCRRLIDQWRGENVQVKHTSTTEISKPTTLLKAREAAREAAFERVDKKAAEFSQTMPLTVEQLLREVYTIIERRLEKSVEAYIASLSAETLGQLDDTADNSTAGTLVAKAINAMDAIIGGGTGDGEGEQQPFDPLDSAIASQIKKQAGEWSEDIHTWIWLVLDTSPLRSKDALRTCEWFLSQLETLERAAGQGAKRLRHELATIAEQLQQAIAEQGVRKLRSQGRRGNTLDDTILQYARLRVFLVAHRGVLQILRTLRGGVTKASDRLRELNKDLNQLACQFRESDAPPSYADREVHGACSASPAMLWSRRDELAARVDLTVESVLGPVQRRLVELMEGVNVQRHSLPPILRKAARQVVVKAWKTAQSSALAEICASKDQDDSGHWGALTESAATSTLYALAAGRRWFLTLPDLETLSPLADQLRAESGTEPTIIEDARGQTAAWYELGGVGLTDVARQLVAQHPEIIAIADRLKTRLDVDWSPL